MSFNNKVVIISGASSGIGAAAAVRLAKLDANLVLIGRNETKLRNVDEECKKHNAKSLVIIADLTEENSAKIVVEKTIERFGKIDVLINNAGAGWLGGFADANAMENYDKTEKVILRQVIRMTHTALPHLEVSKGCIVMVSSVNAMQAAPTAWAYCVAKAGLDHFTRCLAVELAPKGIRVNSVNPGPVKTDIQRNMGLEDKTIEMVQETIRKETLLKRISEPDEIADVIEFLASGRARGVTGSFFVTDNGMMYNART